MNQHSRSLPCGRETSAQPFGFVASLRPATGRAACQVQPFPSCEALRGVPRLVASVLWRRLTSRPSPRPLLFEALRCRHRRTCPRSPQVRTQSSPALPPHLPPRLNRWASLCCASSPRRVGLRCGSCSSARGFRLAFLPTVGRPSAVGFGWCFVFTVHTQGT